MEELHRIEIRALPAHRPVEMRSGHPAGGAAEAEAIAPFHALAFMHVDTAEMHRQRKQTHAVIDDHAVAFVVERTRQHYHSAVAGMHRRACGSPKIRSFVNCCEL